MQMIVNIHINSLGNAAILNLAQLDSDLTIINLNNSTLCVKFQHELLK